MPIGVEGNLRLYFNVTRVLMMTYIIIVIFSARSLPIPSEYASNRQPHALLLQINTTPKLAVQSPLQTLQLLLNAVDLPLHPFNFRLHTGLVLLHPPCCLVDTQRIKGIPDAVRDLILIRRQ